MHEVEVRELTGSALAVGAVGAASAAARGGESAGGAWRQGAGGDHPERARGAVRRVPRRVRAAAAAAQRDAAGAGAAASRPTACGAGSDCWSSSTGAKCTARTGLRVRPRRDRMLLAEGWRSIRITWRQLRDEPAEIAADLRDLLRAGVPGLLPCSHGSRALRALPGRREPARGAGARAPSPAPPVAPPAAIWRGSRSRSRTAGSPR